MTEEILELCCSECTCTVSHKSKPDATNIQQAPIQISYPSEHPYRQEVWCCKECICENPHRSETIE